MAQYTIKARGVHRDTNRYERLERTLHATDDAAAREKVATDFVQSIRDEYMSTESLELYSHPADESPISIFDMTAKKWLLGNVPVDDRPVFSGYSRNQLSEAFQQVRDPENWKNPIEKIMPADLDQDLTGAAIAFFAGSEAQFNEVPQGIHVRAPGYYVDIGA